jgi:hypothetical protein
MVGPFTGGNKVLSDINTDVRCLDGDENVVSDMVSPLYWFFSYDSGKQIVLSVLLSLLAIVLSEHNG